jgi:hypothetical protein
MYHMQDICSINESTVTSVKIKLNIYIFSQLGIFSSNFSFLCLNKFRDPKGVLVLIVSEIDFPSFVQKETTFFFYCKLN